MYHDMTGWGWFLMTFGGLFWVIVIGLAVRLGHGQ